MINGPAEPDRLRRTLAPQLLRSIEDQVLEVFTTKNTTRTVTELTLDLELPRQMVEQAVEALESERQLVETYELLEPVYMAAEDATEAGQSIAEPGAAATA